jgi:hypothetical protein
LYHPVPAHALEELARVIGDLVRRLIELQLTAVLQHQRFDFLHCLIAYKLRRVLLSELLQKLLVRVAQLPDVDLDFLCKVHKHERVLWLSSSCHVQSDGCDIADPAALDEVVV